MKLIIPFCISILLTGCHFQQPTFITCTKQAWCSNQANNAKGTVYHIVIKATADSTKLKFDSLQIAKHNIKDFKVSVLGQSNLSTYYKAGDSILISINQIGFMDTVKNLKKNENIIFYTLNNKKRHCNINSMKALESLLCP
jgi:hypothetical protein